MIEIFFGIYLIIGLVILLTEIRLGRTKIECLEDLTAMVGFVVLAPLYAAIIWILHLRRDLKNKRRKK